MTPKEKAVLLVASMSFSKAKVTDYETGQMVDIPGNIFAKQCALIAVDEILELTKRNTYKSSDWSVVTGVRYDKFWEEVKQEIEKL
jgi:hypothetical protein